MRPLLPDTVDTVIWAPDDGWRHHPKHVEQFTDINKLYIVASCWIIIDTYYTMHGPLNIKFSNIFEDDLHFWSPPSNAPLYSVMYSSLANVLCKYLHNYTKLLTGRLPRKCTNFTIFQLHYQQIKRNVNISFEIFQFW